MEVKIHLVSKNVCCTITLEVHEPILIIFGVTAAEEVGSQKVLYFSNPT